MTAPYVGPGGTMRGIADLINGLRSLNDPGAQARQQILQNAQDNPQVLDQLKAQIQSNPDAINGILGRKPLLDLSGKYERAKQLLTGPMSVSGQAANLNAKNTLDEETRMQGIGAKVRMAEAQRSAGDQTPILDILNKQGINEDAYNQYIDYRAKKLGVGTPTDIKFKQAETTREQSEADKAKLEADKLKREAADDQTYTPIANNAINKAYKAGFNNVFKFYKEGPSADQGGLTDAERIALQKTGDNNKIWQSSMNEYYKDKQLEIESKSRQDSHQAMRDNNIDRFIETVMTKGGPQLSRDEAGQILDRGGDNILQSKDPKDEPIKQALLSLKQVGLQQYMGPANAHFLTAYTKWQKDLQGQEPKEADIQNLQNEINASYGSVPGYKIPKAVLEDSPTDTRGIIWKTPRKQVKFVMDPDISTSLKQFGVDIPTTTEKTTQKSLADRVAELKAAGKSKEEAAAILAKEGYKLDKPE